MITFYTVIWLLSLALSAASYGGGALYVLLSNYHRQNFQPFLITFLADFILHLFTLLDATTATLDRTHMITSEQGRTLCRYNFVLGSIAHVLTPFVYFRLTFNIIFREYRAMRRFSHVLLYTTMTVAAIVIAILWFMDNITCANCDAVEISKMIQISSNVAEIFHLILVGLSLTFLEFDGTDKVSLILAFCAVALELPGNLVYVSKALDIHRMKLKGGSFSMYLHFLLVHIYPLAYPALFYLMTREYRQKTTKKTVGHDNEAMEETCLENGPSV